MKHRLTMIATITAVLALLLSAASAAEAAPARHDTVRAGCRVPGCYVAIALNTTRNQEYGVINYRTREGAVRSAITYCRRRANHPGNCHHTTSARNTCLAVARAYVRKKGVVRMRWYAGTGSTRKVAMRHARAKLVRHTHKTGLTWGLCPAHR